MPPIMILFLVIDRGTWIYKLRLKPKLEIEIVNNQNIYNGAVHWNNLSGTEKSMFLL